MHLVAGGAGFIAQELIKRLLARGQRIFSLDNLSRGQEQFLATFAENDRFGHRTVDCADSDMLMAAACEIHSREPITDVWHLAANSDIPAGIADPAIDLKDTFLTTFELLKVSRALNIPNFRFASSSAIYGDLGDVAIDEDVGPLQPISNYGAMKLASEAQIRAASEAFLQRADIFRFPNVIGTPATHGVIVDFVRKLAATPDVLDVLGDGSQRKPYLHVEDLVDAMLLIADAATPRYNVFNIGPRDEGVTVRFIAETVRDRVAPGARISYGSGGRGWVGDVPRFRYVTDRLARLGWEPALGSREAVIKAVYQVSRQEAMG